MKKCKKCEIILKDNEDGICSYCLESKGQNIKDKCGICGKKIPDDEEHFKRYGNFCWECSAKTNNSLFNNLSHEKTQTYYDYLKRTGNKKAKMITTKDYAKMCSNEESFKEPF